MQTYTRVYKSMQTYTRVYKHIQEYTRVYKDTSRVSYKNMQRDPRENMTVYKDMQECDLKVTYLVDFSVTDLKLVLSQFNSRLDLG